MHILGTVHFYARRFLHRTYFKTVLKRPYTQCIHRIRIRLIKPQFEVEDIEVKQADFKRDPTLGKFRGEAELLTELRGLLGDNMNIEQGPSDHQPSTKSDNPDPKKSTNTPTTTRTTCATITTICSSKSTKTTNNTIVINRIREGAESRCRK